MTYAVGVICLRQSDTYMFFCIRFSARRAEKRTQKKAKYQAARLL